MPNFVAIYSGPAWTNFDAYLRAQPEWEARARMLTEDLIFGLTLVVLFSPLPASPPPALLAPMRQTHRVRRITAPARQKARSMVLPFFL